MLDVDNEIIILSKKYWNELSKKIKSQQSNGENMDEITSEDKITSDFKEQLCLLKNLNLFRVFY